MKNKLVVALLVVAAVAAVVVYKNYAKANDSANAAVNSSSPTSTSPSSSSTAGSTNTTATPAPSDFGPMKTVEIMDPMFNMVAYTMQIPASWQFEGTILHGPGCIVEWASVAFRANSPDMQYGIQLTPSTDFWWGDDPGAIPQAPGCKKAPPMSAVDYGKLVSIRMRPGSEVDSVESSPNEAAYQANIEKSNAQLSQQGASVGNRNPSKFTGELKRLHIHYDLNGHAEEEWLNVAMSVGKLPTSIWVKNQGRGPQLAMKNRIQSTVTVSGGRAPQGQWQSHADAYKAISATLKANPEYNAKFNAYMQEKTNRNIAASWAVTNAILQKGAQEQAQRTQQAQAFIQNMEQQGAARNANFNAQMDRKSANAQNVCDYLLDQQLYVNPTTGQTQMQSSGSNHTFSNGSGPGSTVVQTNSPTYNPNGMLAGNWTELQPIHH
jgi:hypothetical protein